MRISDTTHLSYCTNVHAGESLAEVRANLETHVSAVKRRVSPVAPFGVGLWLAARAAQELAEPGALAAFKALLDRCGLYVFTLNGFPYGAFHGRAVKTEVYKPNWAEPARLAYSNALADLLAELLPADVNGSISTVPGGFKPALPGAADHAAVADNLLQHAAHLHAIARARGKHIALALEPEPSCMLETSDETVAFFERYLFSAAAAQRVASLTGTSPSQAAAIIRSHLGVCLDACHVAVEHERAEDFVRKLGAAGIAIVKIQLSAGIRVARMDARAAAALQAYRDPVYLHHAVERRGDTLIRYLDLPEALAAFEADAPAEPSELRVHYHVPVFLAQLREFESTQPFLCEVMALQRAHGLCAHLEVETYTWDVLPPALAAVPLDEGLARELEYCKAQLLGRSG